MTLDVTIITGMSGAGRSAAADVLEDLGFFVIDNLPPALVAKVAELGRGTEDPQKFALVIDVRSGEFVDDLVAALAELREMGASTRVLFLDAADDVLVRRYEATRRKHPLAAGDRVSDGIASERELLEELKGQADIVLDTTELNVHELRDRLRELFDVDPAPARCRRASCRSATSTASRSTSTSCSTAASCPTRTGWTSCARSRAPIRSSATTCCANPRRARSSRRWSACSRCCSRPTSARASRTSRSGSAAPAGATAVS